MRKKLFLLPALGVVLAGWAQTNAPVAKPPEQEIGIRSKLFYFDGAARQLVYSGEVVVTNLQGTLTCERLTVDLPPEGAAGSQPTNIVAETNVVIDFVRQDATNHVTADKAVYAYNVAGGVTNETVTFTGHAKVTNDKGWITGEPLVWDNIAERFFATDGQTYIKLPGNLKEGTNGAAFPLLK